MKNGVQLIHFRKPVKESVPVKFTGEMTWLYLRNCETQILEELCSNDFWYAVLIPLYYKNISENQLISNP